MKLSARILTNYANVNSFAYGNQWSIRAGDPNVLYFQLVDLDQTVLINLPGQNIIGNFPIPSTQSNILGLRYMVGQGVSNQPASVQVTFPSIDDAKVISLTAVQADPGDASIWKITIPPNLTPTSGNVQFQVAEGVNIRRFNVLNLVSVEYPLSDGSC